MKAWAVISAGHGPPECAWVVHHLGPVFAAAAAAAGVRCAEVGRTAGPAPGTSASIVYELEDMSEGTGAAAALLAAWEGTAQWIGRSPLRPEHRRRNWFVKVARLAVEQGGSVELREQDLEESTMRGGGPGGQHVNTTSSAVRLRHAPTGITVTAREERSQQQNRRLARERLAAMLLARADGQRAANEQAQWGEHNAIERGNARKVFRGPEFSPVK